MSTAVLQGGRGRIDLADVAGQVQVFFPSANSATPYVKSGRLRALAVTSAEPSALVPDLPTVAAAGLPGYESVAMTAMFAPAKTPDAIVRRHNAEINVALKKPEVRERFLRLGLLPVSSTPSELDALLRREIVLWSKVVKEGNIKPE